MTESERAAYLAGQRAGYVQCLKKHGPQLDGVAAARAEEDYRRSAAREFPDPAAKERAA